VNETLNADSAFSGNSMSTDEPSGTYMNNAGHDPHLYWDGPVEGSAPDYTPQLLPGACQSQLAPNDQMCNAVEEPSEYLPMDQDQSVCILLTSCCYYAKFWTHSTYWLTINRSWVLIYPTR
jgi:hypothetical protein